MTNKRIAWLGAGLLAIALTAAGITAILADDRGDGDGSAAVQPTSTPRLIDPGIGNGQPPATAPPGVAPGEPTPPSRPDQPSSSRDTPAPSPPRGTPAPGTMQVLAPIESAGVVVLESFPPQYRLQVKAGLPSGCAKPDGYEMTRAGNDIRVAVYNTLPTGNPVCTAIYGVYDLVIDLGSGLVSGQEYRVNVNGTIVTFRAQ